VLHGPCRQHLKRDGGAAETNSDHGDSGTLARFLNRNQKITEASAAEEETAGCDAEGDDDVRHPLLP
jgi:hypothetical protein